MDPLPGIFSRQIVGLLGAPQSYLGHPSLWLGLGAVVACGGAFFLISRRLGWRPSMVLAVSLVFGITSSGLYAAGILLGMAGGSTWKVGYYGQRNRVCEVIAGMADVRIVDQWAHEDVTLEDFGFTVVTSSGAVAKVDFMEGSPARRLTKGQEIEAYVRASLLARNQAAANH